MIKSFIYNIYLHLNSVRSSWLSYFENTKSIKVGSNTKIDSFVTLKGGIKKGAYLKIGKEVRIRRNCYISATEGTIEICDDVLIAHNTWIAGHGETQIGKNTLIGPNVVIVSSNHDLSSEIYPAMLAPEIAGKVKIGSSCWIGANSTIVPNVTIGNGCIVAGGSVVTTDVEDGYLIAGNPATIVRKISERDNPYKLANLKKI